MKPLGLILSQSSLASNVDHYAMKSMFTCNHKWEFYGWVDWSLQWNKQRPTTPPEINNYFRKKTPYVICLKCHKSRNRGMMPKAVKR